jgi:large subunit ribosomal protein L28
MSRVCVFTGKRTTTGWTRAEKGARRDGGVGNKIKGRTKRKVKPNLRRLKVVIDGKEQMAWVSTRAMKSGLVVRPLKVKPAAKAAAAPAKN